jgi:hypothetical protein
MIHPVPKGEKERTRTALSSRKDDGIHDMYDAVGCRDIGNDDLCVVDVDIAHIDFDNNRITRKGFKRIRRSASEPFPHIPHRKQRGKEGCR